MGSPSGERTDILPTLGVNRSSVEFGIPATMKRRLADRELAVDRESMKRVLSESPQSLKAILEALLAKLQRDKPLVARSCEV
jgi:hypothetical protein